MGRVKARSMETVSVRVWNFSMPSPSPTLPGLGPAVHYLLGLTPLSVKTVDSVKGQGAAGGCRCLEVSPYQGDLWSDVICHQRHQKQGPRYPSVAMFTSKGG